MKGKHKIEVRSKRIVFTIELERNITILRGDSATGKTTLIIAHRISTIQDADKILVLDEGRLAGKGTHDELMASVPTYRWLYESQTGGEAHA